MSTVPPNQPPFDPNTRPDPNQRFDPNAPFDPTNVNDPRYDPSRDPRYDPRWQKAQQRAWRDQMRAQQNQARAGRKAQAQAWKMQAQAQRDQWKLYWQGHRRTSIVGPLLLIAVGVIIFMIHTGKIAPVAFFGWYAHWWPVLLILVGVLRLAEWGIDRARTPADAPPMRYNVGGGVITLLILLACIGLATHTMEWHADRNGLQFFGMNGGENMDHLFGQKHEEDSPAMTHDVAANGVLSIDNPHGDVTVSGTSDDGKVHLSTHKEVYSNSDDTATSRLKQLDPVFDGSNDSLSLRIPSIEGGGADVTLLVPATTKVVLNSNRGDVHVTNLKAPLAVTSNNGEVEVAAITGTVQVHVNNRRKSVNVRSVSGDVTVDGSGDEVTLSDITGGAHVNGDFFGGGHMQHIGGEVGYHSSRTDLSFAHLYGDFEIDGDDLNASEVVGPALVSTRSRNVTLNKITGDVKVVNNHGDVTLDSAPPVGTLTVDNQNGSVTVSLPEKAKFNLQAETSDGDTHSDFSGIHSDGRGVLTGSANGGGPQVRINTSHGDITISHNGGSPLPPPPAVPKLSGFGTVPTPPTPPGMPDVNAITQDAMRTAADALKQSADAIDKSKSASADARERAREAMQQAREAMLQAQQKQREADQLQREAMRDAAQQQRDAAREAAEKQRDAAREAAQRARDAAKP